MKVSLRLALIVRMTIGRLSRLKKLSEVQVMLLSLVVAVFLSALAGIGLKAVGIDLTILYVAVGASLGSICMTIGMELYEKAKLK